MEDLIEALNILKKYISNDFSKKYPTSCEHDVFMVHGIDFFKMTIEDVRKLYKLGFWLGTDWDERPDIVDIDDESTDIEYQKALNYASENYNSMSSFRFGSC